MLKYHIFYHYLMVKQKQFYESVGKRIGWDFSVLNSRIIVKNKKWDFYQEVAKFLKKNGKLLDIGAGSGEKLFKLPIICNKVIGIDNSKSMINKANENLINAKISNVEFKLADSNKLPFKDEEFDTVSCRHSPFNLREIYRALKKKGIFITQQVGERDKQNIKGIFGRGQSYKKREGSLINKYSAEARKLGFKIVRKSHYCATEYYKYNDLIFLLENTPIIPRFNIHKDCKFVRDISKKHNTKYGIKTNSCRYILVLQKQ